MGPKSLNDDMGESISGNWVKEFKWKYEWVQRSIELFIAYVHMMINIIILLGV